MISSPLIEPAVPVPVARWGLRSSASRRRRAPKQTAMTMQQEADDQDNQHRAAASCAAASGTRCSAVSLFTTHRRSTPYRLRNLTDDFGGRLVVSKPDEPGMAKLPVMRPFREANLGDHVWAHPVRALLSDSLAEG